VERLARFGAEDALETRAGELHADSSAVLPLMRHDVHNAPLRGKVGFCGRTLLRHGDGDLEVGAEVEFVARGKCSARPAEILARSGLFELNAGAVAVGPEGAVYYGPLVRDEIQKYGPGGERRWTARQNQPDKPLPMTGKLPTPAELEWARFAAQTPHYVLSSTLTSALWPKTSFLRGIDEIAALKQQPGKDIYLVGGARTTVSLLDAGLVDELRLIVYPLIAGEGRALFATTELRRRLELQEVQQRQGGRVSLIYGIR